MYEAWKPDAAARRQTTGKTGDKLLTRVMYDETPQTYRTFEDLQSLLVKTHGELLTVNEEEFATFLRPRESGEILELLLSQNIAISLRSDEILEKTGLIALAGTIKAIETGTIEAGSRVLCCLTSGVTDADGCARPEAVLRDVRDALRYAQKVAGRG